MVHLRSCHALETRTGGETSNFRGKLGNWGSSRFSSGVITDADPSARHAPLLLIRSHHNVSSLSLSLWSMTLCPPLKAWNLRQKAWTAQLIHSTSVLLNYATKNGQVGAMKVEQVKIISGHTGTIKELQTKTWLWKQGGTWTCLVSSTFDSDHFGMSITEPHSIIASLMCFTVFQGERTADIAISSQTLRWFRKNMKNTSGKLCSIQLGGQFWF